ncbi:MAG: hypothetical protein FJ399_03595, partial [Verrucomicrobia bacterium]|nr:hypothetical protein [Verrucomicrobiota bacterium]
MATANYYVRGMQYGIEFFGPTRTVPIVVDYPPATSLAVSAASVSSGQSVTVTSVTSDVYGNVINQAIDYLAPGQSSWVSGNAGAGTRWDGAAVASHTLAPALVLASAGTWQFRARGQDAYGQLSSFQYREVAVGAAPPTIVGQPQSQTVAAGQPASFSVTATGSEPITYQWRKNGSNLAGATAATFTIANAQQADAANAPGYDVVVTNSVGSATSTAASLTVNLAAPTLATQPASQTVNTGQPVTFSVVATGSAPLAYQWRKSGVNLAGATGATYTIASAQASDAATYTVVVSNSAGTATSSGAVLTVTTLQPIRLAVEYWQAWDYPGYSVDEYQDVLVEGQYVDDWGEDEDGNWVVVGTRWEDAHVESQYVGTTSYANGQYGSRWDTTAGTFNINDASSGYSAATINRGHLLNTYHPGDLITFRLYGSAPSGNCNNYTWALFSPSGSQIAGNWFNGVYAWSFYANHGSGSYRIEVSYQNATGVTPTNATVTYYIPVGIVPAPTITVQPAPASQTVAAGSTVSYSVTAPGAASYQWYKDGGAIAGANSATLELSNVQTSNSGTYFVTASNSGGTVTSNSVDLTVTVVAPSITTQPVSQTVSAGQTATFTIVASGSEPITYQWRKNGSNLAGATAATFTIANAQQADAANAPGYDVVVTNSVGSATSTAASLTVNLAAPSIATQPASQTVNTGQPVTFSVVATGSAPLAYQWRKSGVNLAGATGATYTIASAQTSDAATYTVVVSNSAGTATSNGATLTVTSIPPIRLALQYWQDGDYPNRQVGEHEEYGLIPEQTDSVWDDELGEYVDVTTPEHYGYYMVPDYAADGEFGSRWDTTAGAFNLNDAASGYSAATINRGYVLNAYNVNSLVTFRAWGYAPGGNCNSFQAVLYNPQGAAIASGAFGSNSYWESSFYPPATGIYRIDLTYQGATATSPATGTVSYYIPVGIPTPTLPTITSQPAPASQTVSAGASVSYSVTATGATSYQWRKDGVALSGATSSTLALANLQTSDSGAYSVLVSNAAGSVASNS